MDNKSTVIAVILFSLFISKLAVDYTVGEELRRKPASVEVIQLDSQEETQKEKV